MIILVHADDLMILSPDLNGVKWAKGKFKLFKWTDVVGRMYS